jgi:hypothetical protein
MKISHALSAPSPRSSNQTLTAVRISELAAKVRANDEIDTVEARYR